MCQKRRRTRVFGNFIPPATVTSKPLFVRTLKNALRPEARLLWSSARLTVFLGGRAMGVTSRDFDEVEIGWTFLIRALWGGATNRQIKELMLRHAFETVGTVSFRIATNNLRSCRATEKLGDYNPRRSPASRWPRV